MEGCPKTLASQTDATYRSISKRRSKNRPPVSGGANAVLAVTPEPEAGFDGRAQRGGDRQSAKNREGNRCIRLNTPRLPQRLAAVCPPCFIAVVPSDRRVDEKHFQIRASALPGRAFERRSRSRVFAIGSRECARSPTAAGGAARRASAQMGRC